MLLRNIVLVVAHTGFRTAAELQNIFSSDHIQSWDFGHSSNVQNSESLGELWNGYDPSHAAI